VLQILINPFTWLTLLVIGLGFGVWAARKFFARPAAALKPLAKAAWASNAQHADRLPDPTCCSFLQRFQTGQLNWNVFGILGGLILILLLLVGVK